MNKTFNNKWYKHGVGTISFCIVIGLLLTNLDIFSSFNETWVDRDIRNAGIIGWIYFLGIGVVATACGAPRQVVAFLGGYAFGAISGTLLATLAATMGCAITFYISKCVIKPLVQRKFNYQSKQADNFLRYAPTRKTIIIRLLPFGSNVLTNIIAGSTNVSPKAFFVGSTIGYLPQMLIFSLLGKGILVGSEWKILFSTLLFLFSSYLSFLLYKKYRFNLKENECRTESVDKTASTPTRSSIF
ncbi:TVP38/TMEM64 family protein [Paraglaciecola polaris]|uniref:TVP38/TMEM64 family membrane protein n=1 Tax=Paraglaciecola polaris LMG 21857 TaxID=1129793 RepID=K7A3W0_9ALTE|nr:VTT domain-containing protein [Paraglaciecola polaris]GAC35573.1 hypothetical protein GPLA_4699 [Paraglaciecola polaris LMG 21857]|tara:strand:- start:9395 stop:10123 length:729 start_codon:yes stop_codon:yes gene_type:complete